MHKVFDDKVGDSKHNMPQCHYCHDSLGCIDLSRMKSGIATDSFQMKICKDCPRVRIFGARLFDAQASEWKKYTTVTGVVSDDSS